MGAYVSPKARNFLLEDRGRPRHDPFSYTLTFDDEIRSTDSSLDTLHSIGGLEAVENTETPLAGCRLGGTRSFPGFAVARSSL